VGADDDLRRAAVRAGKDTKVCPDCASSVSLDVQLCPHCGRAFT
jgi:predicted amidophosphoribosyltransferase